MEQIKNLTNKSVTVSIILNLLILIIIFSPYSFRGLVLDILLIIIGIMFSTYSFRYIFKSKFKWWKKLILYIFQSPAIVTLVFTILILVPPFTLGGIFAITELANTKVVQKEKSPNGMKYIIVYETTVGAYTSGHGRLSIKLVSKYFPIIEKNIFYLKESHPFKTSPEFIEWVDDKSIKIKENSKIIDI